MDSISVHLLWFFIFSVFHSVTAHEFFKDGLAKIFGAFFVEHYWRFIYCLVSFGLLFGVFAPSVLRGETYEVLITYPNWLWNIMAVVKLSGIVISYWAFVQFDYFEFWGVKQVFRGFKNWKSNTKWEPMELAGVQRLEVKGIYHFCRHPMLTGGFLYAVGTAPVRSAVIYAFFYTIYMFIGAYYEEKRLLVHFGDQYRDYRKEVGAFWPNLKQIRTLFSP